MCIHQLCSLFPRLENLQQHMRWVQGVLIPETLTANGASSGLKCPCLPAGELAEAAESELTKAGLYPLSGPDGQIDKIIQLSQACLAPRLRCEF